MQSINELEVRVAELEALAAQHQRAHDVLEAVAEGTALLVGRDFFYSLVRHLTHTLDVTHAFVTECTDTHKTRVRTLAYWDKTDFIDNFEYDLAGTPCAQVISGMICYNPRDVQALYYPEGLQKLFPEEAGIESYLGLPLFDAANQVIGHLVIMDENPMDDEPLVVAVLRIFAFRAAGELQRIRLEADRARTGEIERRKQVAESLRDILAVLNSTQTLDYVLGDIVERAQHILQSDACAICRLQDGQFITQSESGTIPESTLPIMRAAMQDAAEQRQPSAIAALLAVPLIVKDDIYGCLGLYYAQSRQFSPEDLDLAMTFSNQAALAIENARLRKKAEEMAAMEERNRIARELHDAVSQTLWSAKLIADVLPEIWDQSAERGRFKLGQFQQLTRAALIEMRSLLLELRPNALIESNIYDLLHRLIETIRARSGLAIILTIEGECTLPSDVQVTLYRITQEALNNVVRHASASHTEVLLTCDGQRAELSIMDDGRGFELDGLPPQHHGIQIMQERSASIGATLKMISQIGNGTVVQLRWMVD